MARIKKAVKALLWALCSVPAMAAFLAIAVMADYMGREDDGKTG